MKPTIVLFVSMLSMPAMAQRDFLLTKQRNVWLTSANAAALTTYSDSTIAHATLSYSHADAMIIKEDYRFGIFICIIIAEMIKDHLFF